MSLLNFMIDLIFMLPLLNIFIWFFSIEMTVEGLRFGMRFESRIKSGRSEFFGADFKNASIE